MGLVLVWIPDCGLNIEIAFGVFAICLLSALALVQLALHQEFLLRRYSE